MSYQIEFYSSMNLTGGGLAAVASQGAVPDQPIGAFQGDARIGRKPANLLMTWATAATASLRHTRQMGEQYIQPDNNHVQDRNLTRAVRHICLQSECCII